MEDIEDMVAASEDVRSEVARPAPLLATSRVRGGVTRRQDKAGGDDSCDGGDGGGGAAHSDCACMGGEGTCTSAAAGASPGGGEPATSTRPGGEAEARTAGVPGTERIWVKTYGCSHNISDSEYMAGALDSYGYQLVPDRADADLWLINSCTVKDPSESAFLHLVREGKTLGKHVVVAGCVTQADEAGLGQGLEGVSVVGISQIDRVVEVVEETLKGHETRLLEKKALPSLDLPKIRKDPLVEIVPLSTGCLGACTYCKTRHARGVLGSYQKSAIVQRVQAAIAEGVKEIWLSSEDTGAYGRDIGETMPALLRALIEAVEAIPGADDVMLRVGMTNPPFILDHLDAIAAVLRHPRVFAFLHVPVQSGSNSVLELMNREYTAEEFRRVCDFLLSRVPGLNLATDIICGFPSETEDDFAQTVRLCAHYKFPFLNISQFYPRPGTKAAAMKRVKTQIVKARSRELTALFMSYQPFNFMVGARYVRAWVGTEVSKSNHSVAHTKGYVKVLLPRDDSLRGRMVYVKITSAAKFHVMGELENPVAVEAFQGLHSDDPDCRVHGTLFLRQLQEEAGRVDVGTRAGRSSAASGGGGGGTNLATVTKAGATGGDATSSSEAVAQPVPWRHSLWLRLGMAALLVLAICYHQVTRFEAAQRAARPDL